MARKPTQPSYRHHKPSGQAVVTLNGRSHYLGKFGTPRSRKCYDELIERWLAGGRKLADEYTQALTVVELIDKYLVECRRLYGSRRTAENAMSRVRVAVKHLNRLFGLTPAAKFGPRSLKLVRQAYIGAGLARTTVNQSVMVVKAMFAWGVSEEMIPGGVHHALVAVRGLRAGESPAAEPRKVRPVVDADVDAVLPHVLPPVRAMIELQRLTGMRPGEVVIMRGRDLEMTGRLWQYRPSFHKTDRLGQDRVVTLGPRAQAIVRPFLRSSLDEFLFRPDEADVVRREALHAARVTPLSCGNKPGSNVKDEPQVQPGERYRVDSYARAILRGCQKAWPAPIPAELKGKERKAWIAEHRDEIKRWDKEHSWTPHRLRHSFATKVRREYGIEAARVLLGHQHVGVTEVYAERDESVASTVALKIG